MISPASLILLTGLIASTTAHFDITHPTPLGKSTDPATGPCGGVTIDLENAKTSEFYVGGEPVAVRSGHPEVRIAIRATLDSEAKDDWVNLYPVVRQEGLGPFCIPGVKAPESWVGKKGLVQVIESGEDGMLFSCAAVTFHAERAASVTTLCSNGTGVTGELSSDPDLPTDGVDLSDYHEDDDNDDDHDHTTTTGTAKASTTVAETSAASQTEATPAETSEAKGAGSALGSAGLMAGAGALVAALL